MSESTKPAWTRLKGEPETAWKAFVSYREQRSPRRMQYVTVEGMAVPTQDCANWCQRYQWRERVAEYDAHLDQVLLAEREAALKRGAAEATRDQLQLLAPVREIIAREAEKLAEASRTSGVAIVKPNELSRMLETMIKLERLAYGQSTEVVAAAQDLSNLSDEELYQLHALTKKASSPKE